MSQEYKISLTSAILININIMLGTGIFINTAVLPHYAGALGSSIYLLVGLFMLPLILSISELLRIHPGGSFYNFGEQEVSPFFGFLIGWIYFVGKLSSATLMIFTAMILLQKIIPALDAIPTLALALTVLSIFIALNMKNLKAGSSIQAMFMGIKSIPIIFVILSGICLFSGVNFVSENFIFEGIPTIIPLVLYATIGFEAACLLSSKIKDPAKNAPRAILISYGIVILTAFLFQTMFYGALGSALHNLTDFRATFPAFFAQLLPAHVSWQHLLTTGSYLAIASSALGGAYGVLFTNNWNLYTLAQNKHTFFAKHLTSLNRNNIPWLCVVIEGLFCVLYMIVTGGKQPSLQPLSSLGIVTAYSLSVVALLFAKKNNRAPGISWWIPLLASLNCIVLISTCIHSLVRFGIEALIMFSILCSLGAIMFWFTRKK